MKERTQNSQLIGRHPAVSKRKSGKKSLSKQSLRLGYSTLTEQAFTSLGAASDDFSNYWCNQALHYERARRSQDATDWGLAVPVWISALLISLIIQIVAFKALFQLFG